MLNTSLSVFVLESGCEETESLEVQSNFYGFKYRDIEKDQDMLKTRETGSQCKSRHCVHISLFDLYQSLL